MKKSGIWMLGCITAAFVAFTAGFFMGRNFDPSPILVQTRPFPSTLSTSTALQTTVSTDPLLVNINTAELEELQRLPGIGPVLAERIVDYRHLCGYFKKPEDLARVEGIGQKLLEEILAYIEV